MISWVYSNVWRLCCNRYNWVCLVWTGMLGCGRSGGRALLVRVSPEPGPAPSAPARPPVTPITGSPADPRVTGTWVVPVTTATACTDEDFQPSIFIWINPVVWRDERGRLPRVAAPSLSQPGRPFMSQVRRVPAQDTFYSMRELVKYQIGMSNWVPGWPSVPDSQVALPQCLVPSPGWKAHSASVVGQQNCSAPTVK